ncbi:MAG: hypothetical protein SNJ58_13655 [Aggregatilineales bacterium]
MHTQDPLSKSQAPSAQDFQAAQAAADPSDPEQAASPPIRAEAAALNPADANAEADLARPARLTQFRSRRRAHFSMAVPAVLLIGYGTLLLSESITPDVQDYPPSLLVGAGVGALALALVARFFINGRRERGLFSVGTTLLGWLCLAALAADGQLTPAQLWAFGIMAIGAALLLGYLFARGREGGVVLVALALFVAGAVALPLLEGAVPADISTSLANLAPFFLIILALLWLPRARRQRN